MKQITTILILITGLIMAQAVAGKAFYLEGAAKQDVSDSQDFYADTMRDLGTMFLIKSKVKRETGYDMSSFSNNPYLTDHPSFHYYWDSIKRLFHLDN